MKILAVQIDVPGVAPAQYGPYLEAEIRVVWELKQANVLREIYFRQDKSGVVLDLECASIEEAYTHLNTLPLLKEGLIAFELIPLGPYGGFARLFAPS